MSFLDDAADWGKKAVTSNPVASTVKSGVALAHGDVGGALKEQINGATLGIGGDPAAKIGSNAANKLAEAAGLTGPDTGTLESDVEEARKRRAAIQARLAATGPTVAPTRAPVTTATAPTLGPTQQVTAASIGSVPTANAPTLQRAAPIAGTSPVAASLVATPQATAPIAGPTTERSSAATVQRVAPVAAASIAPVATAAAAPIQAASIASGEQDQFRQRQAQVTQLLSDAATGKGPSVADATLQRALENQRRQQLSMAAGRAHGGNVSLSLMEAAQNTGAAQAQAAADAAVAKAGEATAARGQLIQAADSARGQDIGLATSQAGLQQQANVTGAQLGTQVNLANAGAASAAGLKQADLEQEARQAAAAREQQSNLTEAGFKQDTSKFNAGATNEADLATQRLEADKNQRDADRTLAAGTTNADLATKTALSNQDVDARRAEAQAKLEQDANTTEAELGARVAMQNAQSQLTALMEQARLQQAAGVTNAELQQQIALKQAELSAATEQFNAQQANAAGGDNLHAALESRQLDQGREATLLNAEGQAVQAPIDAQLGLTKVEEDAKDRRAKLVGQAAGGAGQVAAFFSDRRKKEAIKKLNSSGNPMDEFLDDLAAYAYKYKNPNEPGAAPGQQYGAMAQDIEKSRVGKTMVMNTPGGKMIDTNRATGVMLGAMARMREELESLKARKGAH